MFKGTRRTPASFEALAHRPVSRRLPRPFEINRGKYRTRSKRHAPYSIFKEHSPLNQGVQYRIPRAQNLCQPLKNDNTKDFEAAGPVLTRGPLRRRNPKGE